MTQTVQVNYTEMQSIIKSMNAEQAEIAQLLTKTSGMVDSLHNNQWVGRGADKFFDEMMDKVLPALGRVEKALGTAANIAQQVTQIINDADEGTKSFFKGIG